MRCRYRFQWTAQPPRGAMPEQLTRDTCLRPTLSTHTTLWSVAGKSGQQATETEICSLIRRSLILRAFSAISRFREQPEKSESSDTVQISTSLDRSGSARRYAGTHAARYMPEVRAEHPHNPLECRRRERTASH